MIVAWVVTISFDAYFSDSEHFLSMSETNYESSAVRSPFIFFLILNISAGIAILGGGILRIFLWKRSRQVLFVAAALTLLSFATFDVLVYTDVSAASMYVFAILLGWLLARPVKSRY